VGFAVLEERGLLVDWGLVRLYSEHDDEFLTRAEGIIERYCPVTIVLEASPDPRRAARVRRRIDAAARLASNLQLIVLRVTGDEIASVFDGQATKHQVAEGVVRYFPHLEGLLPEKRRAATHESEIMAVFGAVSLLITAAMKKQPTPITRV
jgi:hypothetical protein